MDRYCLYRVGEHCSPCPLVRYSDHVGPVADGLVAAVQHTDIVDVVLQDEQTDKLKHKRVSPLLCPPTCLVASESFPPTTQIGWPFDCAAFHTTETLIREAGTEEQFTEWWTWPLANLKPNFSFQQEEGPLAGSSDVQNGYLLPADAPFKFLRRETRTVPLLELLMGHGPESVLQISWLSLVRD